MPEKILLSFVGAQDPFATNKDKSVSDGPILTLAGRNSFERVFLYYTTEKSFPENANKLKQLLMTRQPGIECALRPLNIDDPTDYSQLFSTMRKELEEVLKYEKNAEYYISVASGTPQMHTCWIMLAASGEIAANILYLRRPEHVKPGQPLINEINPRIRDEFPRILQRITMNNLPDVTNIDMTAMLENASIIGDSPVLRNEIQSAVVFARTDSPILIEGETGTGKELFARLIHNVSKRCEGHFFAINCGAIAPGLVESELFGHIQGAFTGAIRDKKGAFESAHGGTLFLDEIGELPLSVQAHLLRVLQEKTVVRVGDTKTINIDVRIVAATNRKLEEEIANRTFRNDLFYRLAILRLILPPLRERGSDINKLAIMLLDRLGQERGKAKFFTPNALSVLRRHNWPGNVRELQNVIQRSYLLTQGEHIEGSGLQFDGRNKNERPLELPELNENFSMKDYIEKLSTELVIAALAQTGNNQNAAAKLLKITGSAVSKRLIKHGLNRSAVRKSATKHELNQS